ncbi:putative membrane protein YlmG [Collibacillus ludicampi]|jgi:YggT family protein|uniref:Membrane protein YlmG n=1 Tax=Collibacillus ludicampi TaxID=2771369 RepID=A0AAV4LI80_9BACL|nr:YggT family protein [Collibacillus ludicampi]GIM47468.1 putative membrane protein YlmG [Collibacillus ludicampi]
MEFYLFNLIRWILNIYYYILIARILMSWVPGMERTPIGGILYRLTEPYLSPFRRIIPPISFGGMGLDLSPIVAFLAYSFLEGGIFTVLRSLFHWVG